MRLGDLILNINKLKITELKPTPQEYLKLRKSLSWELYSEKDVEQALLNSIYCVSIYSKDCIIGMGRIVGDGRLCFYIQDIMVDPHAQRQGIGSIIMRHIMSYIYNTATKGAYVGLMSKKGKEAFYELFGFVKRPNDKMGNGMVIPNFPPNQ